MYLEQKYSFQSLFLYWRALRGKLPTNESLLKFEKEEADCYCCYRHGKDDIDHILINGNFAKYVWRLLATRMGAEINNSNIRSTSLH